MRPLLEYCAPVWNPNKITHLKNIEMIQQRAAGFVKCNYQKTDNVTEVLHSSNWELLRSQRENLSKRLFKRFDLPCNLNLLSDIFKSNTNERGRFAKIDAY